MKLFPKKYKYYIKYDGIVYPLKYDPKGWDEQSIAFERNSDFGINSEITVPASFVREDRDYQKGIFDNKGFEADAKLLIKKRDKFIEMQDFYTAKFDYKTAKYDRDFFTVECKEDSIYSKLMADKDTNYTIPMSDMENINMFYDGTRIIAKNTMVIDSYGTYFKQFAVADNKRFNGNIAIAIASERSNEKYNENLIFPDNDEWAELTYSRAAITSAFLKNNFVYIKKSTEISFKFDINVKLSIYSSVGTILPIRNAFIGYTVNGDVKDSMQKVFNLSFTNSSSSSTITTNGIQTLTTVLPENVLLGIYVIVLDASYSPYYNILSVEQPYGLHNIEVSTLSRSAKSNIVIPCITHYEWINALIKKILGETEYILEYDSDLEQNYMPLLATSDSFRGVDEPKMYGNLEDALESVNVLFMSGVKCYGNTIKIVKREKCFPTNRLPINHKKTKNTYWEFSTEHVFNKFIAGWDKGTVDDDNGTLEVLAKNEFANGVEIGDDNSHEIMHPYIGSPYAIENYLRDITDDDDADGEYDRDILIFACNKEIIPVNNANYAMLIGSSTISLAVKIAVKKAVIKLISKGITELAIFYRNYVGTPSGAFDIPTYYNLPMSPKRIMLAHNKYNFISSWRNGKSIELTKAERDANVSSQMAYESEVIYEDSIIPYQEDRLFLPLSIHTESAFDFDTLDDVSGENSYNHHVINGEIGTVQGWVDKVAFKQGKEESQEYQFIAKEI